MDRNWERTGVGCTSHVSALLYVIPESLHSMVPLVAPDTGFDILLIYAMLGRERRTTLLLTKLSWRTFYQTVIFLKIYLHGILTVAMHLWLLKDLVTIMV
jgi:hypothetical protein